jgi:hypothetical protein
VPLLLMNEPGLPKNHCDKIWRATGAAAWTPKPARGTVTTTRIGLLVAVAGTKHTYHE